MSFSTNVKKELAAVIAPARHCRLAELAAILGICGDIYTTDSGARYIQIISEHDYVINKSQILIKKSFDYESEVAVRYNTVTKSKTYILTVNQSSVAHKILLSTRIMDVNGRIKPDMALVDTVGISNICCKRAFLRGAFITSGSISDPEKSYHFEIAALGPEKAKQLMDSINSFDLDARIVERRRSQVVYLKEGSQITDMLNVMGAHHSLLEMENVRVLKDVRNSINRKVNCETANLNKTVSAAYKQIADINYINKVMGLSKLEPHLEELARLRLQFTDISLKELGEKLSEPVGKSGVNHRLRKISEIAERLREQSHQEENYDSESN